MGEVYKARDTRLERTVAIKVLPADMSPFWSTGSGLDYGMVAAIWALVTLALFALLGAVAQVWGWRGIGQSALTLLAAGFAILFFTAWRERRARQERGGPTERTALRWEREHVNGRLSWVEEVPYRERHYWFGVIVLSHVYEIRRQEAFGAREEVQRQADAKSECPQPCGCPHWARVPRPIHK